MANRHTDINLRFAQVSALSQHFGLVWLGYSQHSLLTHQKGVISPWPFREQLHHLTARLRCLRRRGVTTQRGPGTLRFSGAISAGHNEHGCGTHRYPAGNWTIMEPLQLTAALRPILGRAFPLCIRLLADLIASARCNTCTCNHGIPANALDTVRLTRLR